VTGERPRVEEPDARARIVTAGMRCIVRDGIPDTTMASIATEAGVSKALLHYHFAHRANLLAHVVTGLGRRLIERERLVLTRERDAAPVDALWGWVSGELARGELHALLTTATVKDAPVATAQEAVLRARRDEARRTVRSVFQRLSLTPRVHMDVIADTCLVFMDGLAIGARAGDDARLSFDVFWLALLSLGE
jgi:AcrR family transcriptional regulator